MQFETHCTTQDKSEIERKCFVLGWESLEKQCADPYDEMFQSAPFSMADAVTVIISNVLYEITTDEKTAAYPEPKIKIVNLMTTPNGRGRGLLSRLALPLHIWKSMHSKSIAKQVFVLFP